MRTYLVVLFSVMVTTGVQAQQHSASTMDTIFEGRPIRAWIAQLADTPVVRSVQARQAVRRMGERARPYLPAITELLAGSSIMGRVGAANALGDLGSVAAPAIPALVRAMSDPLPPVRTAAAEALGDIGVATPEAVAAADAGTKDPAPLVRFESFYALGQLSTNPVPSLRRALRDPDPLVRISALRRVAALGPAARDAAPEVTALLADTVTREAPPRPSRAFFPGEAAWTLSRIVPRRIPHTMTYRATIRPGHSLGDDGRGPFVHRSDSTAVFACEALNIHTQWYGPLNCGPGTPKKPNPNARALVLDLSQPASPGAVPLGTVRDTEVVLHAFWKHDHDRGIVYGVAELDPSPEVLSSERIVLEFPINGEGTTQANLVHPTASQWRIYTPPGAVGRLWNIKDRDKPVDRGLYRFSFDVAFERLAAEDGTVAAFPIIAEKP